MGKKEMDLVTPLRHGGNSHRQFILEGHVEFAQVIIILYRCIVGLKDAQVGKNQQTLRFDGLYVIAVGVKTFFKQAFT